MQRREGAGAVATRFGWLCSHESYQPEELVEQAVLAEEAGFDLVLASDHFTPWVDDVGAAGFVWSWLVPWRRVPPESSSPPR
jgi:alkanesulfonate monooxygenase SsuD/methylene tetrahydromethanopterin reductase-like flavin-dependent oxidoreductase (luciferase family)